MAKIEKILKKWRARPREVSRDEVLKILNRFGIEYQFKRGSHIVARHDKLVGQKDFGLDGEFTIPVKNGRYVKGRYLKTILLALEIIQEETGNEEKS